MAQKPFWEIVKDHEKQTFEVISERSYNDEGLNKVVAEMVDAGMPIQCETPLRERCPDRTTIISSFAAMGYKEESGLWQRAKDEFRRRCP